MTYPPIVEGHMVDSCECNRCSDLRLGKLVYDTGDNGKPLIRLKRIDEMTLDDYVRGCDAVMNPKPKEYPK